MNVHVRRKALAIIGSGTAVVLIVVAAVLVATRSTTSVPGGPGGPSASPPVVPATATVQAFFHKSEQLTAVSRTVSVSADKPSAVLSQLLAGPTAAERQAGYYSFFSAKTAHLLRSVQTVNGVAHADFGDFRLIIPNASSSAGSKALLDELDATLKQFGGIKSTVYSFNGNVAAFYEWLQRVPPGTLPPVPADKAARDFLRQVAGMRELRSEAIRTVAAGLVEVDLRSDSGSGPMTTVSLRPEGSTGMGPFSGQVTFAQPTASRGWLVVTYQSAKTGAVAAAAAVPVSFSPHAAKPQIGSVRVTSGQPIKDGWLTLPAGAGRVVLVVRTAYADHVRVYLTPTGTGTAPLAKLIAQGTPAHGQCTIAWDYPDQPLLAHLSVDASGPGGSTEVIPFNVIHR